MTNSAVDVDALSEQLISTKLYRENEIRRPFQKALEMAEQKAKRIRLTSSQAEASSKYSVSADDPSEQISFDEYYRMYHKYVQSSSSSIAAPPTESGVVKWLIQTEQNPLKEENMKQMHVLVQQLFIEAKNYILQRKSDIEYTELFFLSPNVQHLFTPLRRISSNRFEAYFVSGYKRLKEDCFVIRTAVDYESTTQHTILYSAIIGSTLNTLRSITPCFMYSYGGALNKSKKKDMFRFTSYFEYIEGDTLDRLYDQFTTEESYQLLLLLAYSLFVAQKQFQYCNHNLRCNAIRIRNIKPKKYSIKDYTFSTKRIPIIIDYDSSSIHQPSGDVLFPLKSIATEKTSKLIPILDVVTLLRSVCKQAREDENEEKFGLWNEILEWIYSRCGGTELTKLQQVNVEEFITFLVNDKLKKPFDQQMS